MSFQPRAHCSRLQSYSRWCRTRVVSDVLQRLPKIPQIGFTLEVHLLEEVEEVETERCAGFRGCSREPAESEQLHPFGRELIILAEAVAETY